LADKHRADKRQAVRESRRVAQESRLAEGAGSGRVAATPAVEAGLWGPWVVAVVE